MAYRVQERWVEIRKGGDFAAQGQRLHIPPVLARILKNRGLETDEEIRRFLYGSLQDLENPLLLKNAREAAAFLHEKVLSGKKIRIIGDYDADGICATFILYDTLRQVTSLVDYDIPDRIRDGFGLNVRLIEKAKADRVDTIVTCDNGIAATEAVRRARELDMHVLLTDHHEPNYRDEEDGRRTYLLPPADLIVDPKLPDCPYPNKDLCGAGVAWKLMHIFENFYIRRKAARVTEAHPGTEDFPGAQVLSGTEDFPGEQVLPGTEPLAEVSECPLTLRHLPFAAIATVTDIMQLTGENRILVKHGLSMIPDSDNTGLRALLSAAGIAGRKLRVYDIGFILGPCLNASGRLDTAKQAVRLLCEEDTVRAAQMAEELSSLNAERIRMTNDGKELADQRILEGDLLTDMVLVLHLPGIHESVAGIIASKVKESYNRPAFILTDSQDPDILKGSGRSVEGFNMFEGLTAAGSLLEKFGGHAMAAGISLRRENLDQFRDRINAVCPLTEEDLIRKVRIDMRLPLSVVTEELIASLDLLEPCGTGMPQPLFAQSGLKVLKMHVLGQKRNAVRFLLADGDTRMEALWFGDASWMEEYLENRWGADMLARLRLGEENSIRLSVCFHPAVNEFRGFRSLQVRISHFM